RSRKIGSREIGIHEADEIEIRASEICRLEISAYKSGKAQIRIRKYRPTKIGLIETRNLEIRSCEIDVSHFRAAKVGAPQVVAIQHTAPNENIASRKLEAL